MTAPVSLSVAAVSVDSVALAGFWGRPWAARSAQARSPETRPVDAAGPESGPRMLFHNVSGLQTANNRFHLILVTEHYHEEIERLTGLGARTVTETKLPEVRWTTLADPEGNEFDLVTWQPA